MTVTEPRQRRRGTRLVAVATGCALAGASVLLAVPAHAAPAPTVTLSGVVTAGGAAVQGVEVELVSYDPEDGNWDYESAVGTAADGSWSLSTSLSDQGAYSLEFVTEGSSAIYSADQYLGGVLARDTATGVLPQTLFTVGADGSVSGAPSGPIATALSQTDGAVAVTFTDAASGAKITGPADSSDGYFSASASLQGIDATGLAAYGSGSASSSSSNYAGFNGTLVIGQVAPGTYYGLTGLIDDERSDATQYHSANTFVSVAVPAAGQQAAVTLPFVAIPAGASDADASSAGSLLPNPSPVSISGAPQVGSVLTAVVPATSAAVSYQWWYADSGTPIPGATGATLTVPASAIGHVLGVVVLFNQAGYSPATRTAITSSAVTVGSTIPGTVKVSGTASFGKTVKVSVSALPTGAHVYGYQWLRAGKAIAGATSSSYKVQAADVAQKLSVVASVTAQGFTDGTVKSTTAVTVKKDTPKVTAVVAGKPSAGKKVTVTVTVVGPSKLKAGGKVKIQYTKTKSKTVTLNSKTGKAKVALPAYAKKGSYTVKLSYAGSSKYNKASGKVVVKVVAKK